MNLKPSIYQATFDTNSMAKDLGTIHLHNQIHIDTTTLQYGHNIMTSVFARAWNSHITV